VAATELDDARRADTGVFARCVEAFLHDGDDVGEVERSEFDQVGLAEEGLGVVGEEHPHGGRLRPGEDEAEGLRVVLQAGAEQFGAAANGIDSSELVEDDARGGAFGRGGEDREELVDRFPWVAVGHAAEVVRGDAEVDGEPARHRVERLA